MIGVYIFVLSLSNFGYHCRIADAFNDFSVWRVDFSFNVTLSNTLVFRLGGREKSRGLLRDFTIPASARCVSLRWEAVRQQRGQEEGSPAEQIRNCRHIENHNSWRRAEDRAIPGAYRDRYLDRVTINTDPGEGGHGHYLGTVWRSHLYLLTHTRTLLLPSPSVFHLPPVETRYRESNYFRYAKDIGNALSLVTAICFMSASGSCKLRPRSSPIQNAQEDSGWCMN